MTALNRVIGARELKFPLLVSEIVNRKTEHGRKSRRQKIFYALQQLAG
jgi:hypothetical protein